MHNGKHDPVAHAVAGFVAEHLADAVLVLDSHGRLASSNRAAREILGPSPLASLIAAVDGESSWSAFIAHAQEGERTTLLVAPASQADFALRVEAASVEGHTVVLVRDARHERRRDAELERVRRSDATGQLAMRVVHDMNNILTPILCMSTLLLAALDGGSPTTAYAREIEEAAQRAVELAREMREFLRKSTPGDRRGREPDEAAEA